MRAPVRGKFAMTRDEVGVQMGLDNVFNLPPIAGCRFKVDIYIALGMDDAATPSDATM
jgi:hypothetical protein